MDFNDSLNKLETFKNQILNAENLKTANLKLY